MTISSPSSWAAWSRPARTFFLVSFFLGLGWNLLLLLVSDGWSLDDELSHYLRSRSVWENPLLLFDVWTRTGRNLFHFLPAHFGLTAARLWTLAFAGGAVWLTTSLASHLGVRHAWLVPLLLWFQPWFAELSWGVLTQTPFLFFWLLGIWLLVRQRWALSGLCFGYLPLVRHEGIAILGLWALVLFWRVAFFRSPKWRVLVVAGAVSALPLFFYNLASWWYLGELPIRVFFDAKPTEIYGHGSPWHFALISFVPAGIFTVALAFIGLPRALQTWRTTWPLLFYPAYFFLHTVIFWFGLFASGGYYHFLMPMAPGLAIVAALGADACYEKGRKTIAALLLTGTVVQGLILFHVHAIQLWQGTPLRVGLQRDTIVRGLEDALDWQAAHRPNAPVVDCKHVYAAFSRDWIESRDRQKIQWMPISEWPPGGILIWENKYSDLAGFDFNHLTAADSGWTELAVFANGNVRVFEKQAAP